MVLNALAFSSPLFGSFNAIGSPTANFSASSGFGNSNPLGTNNLFSTIATLMLLSRLMDRDTDTPSTRELGVPLPANETVDIPDEDTPAPVASTPPAQTSAQATTATPTAPAAPAAQTAPAAVAPTPAAPAVAPTRSLQGNFEVPTVDFLKVIQAAGTGRLGRHWVRAEELTSYIQRVGANSYEGQIATMLRDVILPKFNVEGLLNDYYLVGLASADKKVGTITRQEAQADGFSAKRGSASYYGLLAWNFGLEALARRGISLENNPNLFNQFTFILGPETPADIKI